MKRGLYDDGRPAYIDDDNRGFFGFNHFLVGGQAYMLSPRVDGWFGLYNAGHFMVALIDPGFDDFECSNRADRGRLSETIRTLKRLVDMRDEWWRVRREEAERRDAECDEQRKREAEELASRPEPVYERGPPTTRLTPAPRAILVAMRDGAVLHERGMRWSSWTLQRPGEEPKRMTDRPLRPLIEHVFIDRDGEFPDSAALHWYEFDWKITDAGRAWLAANAGSR